MDPHQVELREVLHPAVIHLQAVLQPQKAQGAGAGVAGAAVRDRQRGDPEGEGALK